MRPTRPGSAVRGGGGDATGHGWAAEAACAPSLPPDSESIRFRTGDFYPSDADGARAAVEICRRCPVRGRCLAEALRRGETYGVWGGTVFDTRLRRELRRTDRARSSA